MQSVTARKFINGKRLLKEKGVSSHIPYTRLVDPHTVKTKDNKYIHTIRVGGMSAETSDVDEINYRKNLRNNLFRSIADSRTTIYNHIIRRRISDDLGGEFNGFAKRVDTLWREKRNKEQNYINEQYFSLVYDGNASAVLGNVFPLQSLLNRSKTKVKRKEIEREALKTLYSITRKAHSGLLKYSPKLLGEIETEHGVRSEVLEFLSTLINGESRHIIRPTAPLNTFLSSKRISFGYEVAELRGTTPERSKLAGVLGIKEYCIETAPGMLDVFMSLPYEFIITQSFSFKDRYKTLDKMKIQRNRLRSVEDESKTLADEIDQAIDEVGAGRVGYGSHQLTALCYGKDEEELLNCIAAVDTELTNLGVMSVREDLNLEVQYWSQLPGNTQYRSRAGDISTKNFAAFSSFHNFPVGKRKDNYWGSALAILETTSGTPFYFNLHFRDLGHFILIGHSGTGKTVLLAFIIAQAQRFNTNVVVFDKDRGLEIFIRAMGGHYSIITPGVKTGFAPFQLERTNKNSAFLNRLMRKILTSDDPTLSAQQVDTISNAINAMYELPKEKRILRNISRLLGGDELDVPGSLKRRLNSWINDGERAWLFDNDTDEIAITSKYIGFDLTDILDDEILRNPAMQYMFHRNKELLADSRTIKIIDEGWKGLTDEDFTAEVIDDERTGRKKDLVLGFASQEPGDIIDSSAGKVIMNQSPLQIFFPNYKANYIDYKKFNVTDREFEIIRDLPEDSYCFLIKHGRDSVIARLDLTGLDEIISVMSGREETVKLMEDCIKKTDNNPDNWLPIFYQKLNIERGVL